MPLYSEPLEEIDESVIHPIILSVTNDVLERMDLPKDIPILIKGNASQHVYKNSTLQERIKNQEIHNRLITDTILYLETSIEDTDHQLLSTPVYRPEEKPIFNDPKLSVVMTPAVVNKKFEISFTFTGTEKEVERWRTILRRKASQGNLGIMHMVTYHFPIPMLYMYLLAEIYNLRQNVSGYENETFSLWLKEHFIRPFTVITNQKGEGEVFVIQEKQIPIQGWFDFGTNPPKPEKDNDATRYSLTFAYSFYFDCPETMVFKTPLIIHNQHLPYKFINTTTPLELDMIQQYGAVSQELLNKMRWNGEKTRPNKVHGIPGLAIPWYDDWMDYYTPRWYESWLRIMIQVDVDDPTLVVDLKELGGWEISPLVLRYLYDVRESLASPYDALFSLSLWRWGELQPMSDLTIDENFVIRTKEPLDPRQMYHLMLAINYDPTTLTDKGIEDLLKHACFMKHFLSILSPELRKKYDWDLDKCAANPGDDKPFTKDDWRKIVDDDFTKKGNPFVNDINIAIWNLVGIFTIISRRQET